MSCWRVNFSQRACLVQKGKSIKTLGSCKRRQERVRTWRRVKSWKVCHASALTELPTFGDGILCFNQSGIQDKFARVLWRVSAALCSKPLCRWGNANIQSSSGNGCIRAQLYEKIITLSDNGNTSSEYIRRVHAASPSQAHVTKLSLNVSCPQSDAFAAGHVQPVPRMGYVAGTLEDAYFKQIMVFLANAEPY